MMNENFACVILNYNDAKTTIDLVEKIKNYENIGNIIIVDNCSTDNSLDILSKVTSDKIILISSDCNGGYGYGNNYGVNYAVKKLGYRYILISNPDVEFNNDTINCMLDTLKNNKKCAIVAPVQLDRNDRIIKNYAWKMPTVWQYILTSGLIMDKIYNTNQYKKDFLNSKHELTVDCVPGAFLGIDIYKFKGELYDEEFFLYCEELVIGMLVRRNDYESVLLIDKRYKHMHAVSINKSISSIRKQRKILRKSKMLFLKKYLKANTIQLLIGKLFFYISDLEAELNEKKKNVFVKKI